VIESGFPSLRTFAEGNLPIASAAQIRFANGRHDLKISEIAVPADAAHVIEAEAFHGVCAIIITGPVIPASHCIGRQLDHPERITGARMRFSAAMDACMLFIPYRSDNGIDIYCFFHYNSSLFLKNMKAVPMLCTGIASVYPLKA
jgi:hypothetical protein